MSTKVEKVRSQAADLASDVRAQAGPRIAEARQTLTDDVLPAVHNALSEAREQVTPLAEEAFRRSHEAAVRGHEAAAARTPHGASEGIRSRGRKKWVVLAALAAAAAVAARKLLGGRPTTHPHDAHQTSMPPMTPTPTMPTQPRSDPDGGDDLLETNGGTPTDQDLLAPEN